MPVPNQTVSSPAAATGGATPGRLPPAVAARPRVESTEPPDWTMAELEAAMQKADAAGDTAAAQHFAEQIRAGNYREVQSDLKSAALGFSEGATLGWGGELAAAIRAGTEQAVDPYLFATINKFQNLTGTQDVEAWKDKGFFELVNQREAEFWEGKDYSQRYRDALASHEGQMRLSRLEDPWLTMGGEFAGGAGLTAAPAAGLLRGATGKIGALGRMGALSATEGAVAGLGHSGAAPIQALREQDADFIDFSRENMFEVSPEANAEIASAAGDVGIGATIGGGAGIVLPAVGSAVRAGLRSLVRPITKGKALSEMARQEVADAIKRDILDDGLPLEQAIRKAQQEMNEVPGMTAADIGHHTKDLTEKLVNRGLSGSGKMADFLDQRNKEQWRRMHPRLAEALTGDRNSSFYRAQKQVLNDIRDKSKAAYAIAELQPVRFTPEMRKILDNKVTKQAIKLANKERAIDGLPPLVVDDLVPGRTLSTSEIDSVVKGLDGIVNKSFRHAAESKTNIPRKLRAQRDAFTAAIYAQNPDYARARKTFANETLLNEALEQGKNILSENPDMLRDVVRGMSPAERQHLKIGVLQAVVKRLGDKSDTTDLTKDIWNKPNARDALRVAFGGKKKFEDFMKYIEREQNLYQTFYQAVGNSQTARRLAQQEVARGGGLAYAVGYFTAPYLWPGAPMGLVGSGARRAYESTMAPSRAQIEALHVQSDELARMLQSRDLQGLMRPHTLGGLLESGVPVSSAAATGGLLSTGAAHGEDYGAY